MNNNDKYILQRLCNHWVTSIILFILSYQLAWPQISFTSWTFCPSLGRAMGSAHKKAHGLMLLLFTVETQFICINIILYYINYKYPYHA